MKYNVNGEIKEITMKAWTGTEPEPVRYRYVYSEMTNEDLDGYFVELEFEADEDNHVNENALSVESFTQAEIEQDIAAQMEWGLDEADAREYIMQRVVRV